MAERIAKSHIERFDDLDFNVFSNQQWDRLHESHSKDITVHWRDGQTFPADRCARCGNDSRLEFDGEGPDGGLINPRYVCESCAFTYWFDGEAIRELKSLRGEQP